MTPPTTGPLAIPARSSSGRSRRVRDSASAVSMPRASAIPADAWSARGSGRAGDRHVRIADGLDLLDPAFRGQPIEQGEELVEEADHSCRIGLLGPMA